ASEPDIVNPIFFSWDERGRLFVAETIDYPNEVKDGSGNDRIKILEDTDGDGRCDKVTIFADGLNIPTSLTHWNGGIIVAQAPDFLFLKDTDGDDKADFRKVMFSGWGVNDTHAGPSNLRYGIDNWIYGAIGYSRFKGELGGKYHDFGSGIFRMQPDGSDIEFLHQFNNNTWGLGLNAAGEVFGSTANNNPAFFGGVPLTAYTTEVKGTSAKMIADSKAISPITPNIRQVDAWNAYTAGAGYALATSDNFPESWRDNSAFISAPTGHLLGRFEHSREGAGYKATNRHNLIASADEWFSPVAAEVGPDGNLWIADWYNFIIQHNPVPTVERAGFASENGKGNAHVNPLRDEQHGRIYRLVWEGGSKAEIESLEGASQEDLVAAFHDPNLFWRNTAQRLLLQHDEVDASIRKELKALVAEGGRASVHALWTLHGKGWLDRETHQAALLSGDSALQRNAIRAIEPTAEGMQLFFDTAIVQAEDLLVRLAAFNKLATFPDRDRVERAAKQLIKVEENFSDEWLQLSLEAGGAGKVIFGNPKPVGPNLLPNPSFEKRSNRGVPGNWWSTIYQGEAEIATDP
ncbi:MAG: PVC-type heme-binding CxxCH protein, partial [Verrucomicrobiota bacterium]